MIVTYYQRYANQASFVQTVSLQACILLVTVIAGNPHASRTFLVVAIALLFLALLGSVFLATRKKTNPQQVPPLHPAMAATRRANSLI
jgi:uncharacterized protein (DUF58 family)